jgi:hypothetical protein
MSEASATHTDFELHNVVTALVHRARTENRTVSAHREAADILRQFPETVITVSELEGLILDACTQEPGVSVEFGG